jgi:hypothetical protein
MATQLPNHRSASFVAEPASTLSENRSCRHDLVRERNLPEAVTHCPRYQLRRIAEIANRTTDIKSRAAQIACKTAGMKSKARRRLNRNVRTRENQPIRNKPAGYFFVIPKTAAAMRSTITVPESASVHPKDIGKIWLVASESIATAAKYQATTPLCLG